MSQQSALEYIRHGQTPFFRLPMVKPGIGSADVYKGYHAAIVGVPTDAGTTYQPGARMAPYHLRRTSALLGPYHPTHRIDVFERLTAVDGGNVAAPPFSLESIRQLVQLEVGAVVEAGATPFLVGGDHSIALPALRAVAQKHGELAVVHVDAHFDTSGPETWGEAFHHGTCMKHALEEGLIARGQLHQVGIRVSWKGDDERDVSDAHDAKVYDMQQIESEGIRRIASQIREQVGDRPTYISFDIDGVDPAYAPGTGTPVPGGMTSREAISLLRLLGGVKLVGMDLVEVAPALDHADITCHLGAQLLYEGLALRALHQ